MGADCYILKTNKKMDWRQHEDYYRDCYNHYSSLNAIGLSWWVNVKKFTDDDGVLLPDKAKELKELVKLYLGYFKSEVEQGDKWNEQFAKDTIEANEKLIKFLGKAIKIKSKIYCSL